MNKISNEKYTVLGKCLANNGRLVNATLLYLSLTFFLKMYSDLNNIHHTNLEYCEYA